tara:strand:- start:280 stop:771 length:492 start_codon:yes stop_codon:yes gene_type:complete
MSRLNKIILIGTVSSEPKTSVTNTGDTVTNFQLSVERQQTENAPNQSDTFTIIAWRDLAEVASKLSPNTTILAEGSIRNRNYENNEGQRIYVTEIEARTIKEITASAPAQFENTNVEPVLETPQNTPQAEEVFDFNEAIKQENEPANVQETDFSKEIGEDVPF